MTRSQIEQTTDKNEQKYLIIWLGWTKKWNNVSHSLYVLNDMDSVTKFSYYLVCMFTSFIFSISYISIHNSLVIKLHSYLYYFNCQIYDLFQQNRFTIFSLVIQYLICMGDLPLQVSITRAMGKFCQAKGCVRCRWGGWTHEKRMK